MADIVSPQKRSEMMSGIKGKNTKPELFIRKALHALGFRYRLHVKGMPGKPDLVFSKYKAIILVQGCFWHGHDCHLFKWPKSRPDFWREKILKNKQNDEQAILALREDNWRVLQLWECALKGKERLPKEDVIEAVTNWLVSGEIYLEIRGKTDGSV